MFLLGITVLHVDQNYDYETRPPLEFFGIPVNGSFIFDIGILLVSISFLLEFYLTFKPIKILTEGVTKSDLVEKTGTEFNNSFKEKKYESSFPEGH